VFRAVVVGHGDFAAGLVSAVRGICGREERFVTLSNQDFPADQLEHRLREEIAGRDVNVVFTDLPAGSAAMAARRVSRDNPQLIIVTGANLATLLEFALSAADTPTEAARAAAEKGRASIALLGLR
jgi:mannose/fructose-specific phosphotransferase system component IIA